MGTVLLKVSQPPHPYILPSEDKAIEAYKKAAELDPKLTEKAKKGMTNVADIYSIAANAQYNLRNAEAAAEIYWKGFNVKKDPLVGVIDSISVFNAGSIFMMDQKYDRAIEILQVAMDNNVWEGGETPYLLSYALMQTDQFDKAKTVLTRGLEMFPGNKKLIESMVTYYALTQGDFGEIKGLLEEALKTSPDNMAIWNGLGQVYLEEGDSDKSIEYFTKYVTQFPDEVQPNFYLGDVWYAKGEKILKDAEDDKTMSKAARDAASEQAKDAFRQAWKYLKVAYDNDNSSEAAVIQRLTYVTYRLIDDPGMEEFYKNVESKYQAIVESRTQE